jgi:hypothetical protein
VCVLTRPKIERVILRKLVRIIKAWDYPDLMRQTPERSGIWDDIEFTLEPVTECDYVIILNYIPEDTTVVCSPENIWAIMQEPYIKGVFEWMVRAHKQFSRVFSHHIPARSSKYIPSQPCLPWHVNKDYDELVKTEIPLKTSGLSCIMSNLAAFSGHINRMKFLEYIKTSRLEIDIFGKGINFIEDKWDGLSPYNYSLVAENESKTDYWTEKIADCFLAFTMPIYYGCKNLEDYFPRESFITIDINHPENAEEIIKNTIQKNAWGKNLGAIIEARNLVLNKYQFFPYITERIMRNKTGPRDKKEIRLEAYKDSLPKRASARTKHLIKNIIR